MITSYTSSAISGAFRFDSEFTWKYMSFTLMKQGSMIQQEPTCHSCCWNTLDRIQNEIWTQYSSKHCSIIELQRRGIESIRLRERILGVFVEIGHSDPGRKLHDTKRKG
jgi:ribosomal protein L37AE/L43A